MVEVVISLADCDSIDPSDAVMVYTNINAVGNAAGPLKDSPDAGPVRMFPGLPAAPPGYAEGQYLRGEYLGPLTAGFCRVRVGVGPAHWGRVRVGLVAVDRVGNAQASPAVEAELTVNSAPEPINRLAMEPVDAEDGRLWLTYTESPQLRAEA